MSKMIQIRNVPDDLHRTLKMRAAGARMSLSDYLLSEIREVAHKPTLAELAERIGDMPALKLEQSAADLIRRDRDSH